LQVLEEHLPLVVCVSGMSFDASELKVMVDGFEKVFARGERYAVLFVPQPGVRIPGPQERQALSDWANHPRVVDISKRLCVGTAAIISNPLFRVALSAIVSFQPIHSRVYPVQNVERGLELCLGWLETQGVPLSKPAGLIQYEVRSRVRQLLDASVASSR
jgi:hypothetical protein